MRLEDARQTHGQDLPNDAGEARADLGGVLNVILHGEVRNGTERARVDHLANPHQRRLVHIVVPRKAQHSVRRGARHQRFDLGHAASDRLLHVHVLAVLHREQRQLAVRLHRRQHVDRVDLWVERQCLGARVHIDAAVRARPLCRIRHNRAAASIPQPRQLSAARALQRIRVQRRDVSCTVKSYTQEAASHQKFVTSR
mgnify:CR=1 FL=1